MPVCYFLLAVLALVAGCSVESTGEYNHPYYVNNSGVSVKITAVVSDTIDEPDFFSLQRTRYENEMKDGDWWKPDLGRVLPPYFKIEFFSDPKVCLVFDGETERENDIRYWKNYTLVSTDVEKIDEQHTNYFYSYYYYLTPDIMQQATEENCL